MRISLLIENLLVMDQMKSCFANKMCQINCTRTCSSVHQAWVCFHNYEGEEFATATTLPTSILNFNRLQIKTPPQDPLQFLTPLNEIIDLCEYMRGALCVNRSDRYGKCVCADRDCASCTQLMREVLIGLLYCEGKPYARLGITLKMHSFCSL